LIYDDVKNEIKKYQEELDKESIDIINNYYQKEHLINKKDFATAIRLFTTLVLFQEEDKENKIKSNHNNLVNYLKTSDLWKKDIYDNEDFNKNLNELKLINAKISQIIHLYEVLGRDIEDNFYDDVKGYIDKEKSKIIESDDVKKNDTLAKNYLTIDVDNESFKKKSDDDADDDNDDDDDDPFKKKSDDEDDEGERDD